MLLAVCHAVVIDPDTQTYQGSSPDEVALVQGAAGVGVKLLSLQFGEMVLRYDNATQRSGIHITLLNTMLCKWGLLLVG